MRGLSASSSVGALLFASQAFAQDSAGSAVATASGAITSAASQASSMASTAMSGIPVTEMTQSASASSVSASTSATQTSSSAAMPSNSNGPMQGGGYGAFNVTPNTPVDTTTSYNYSEPYRNIWHFSPPYNWMNDPNGPLYDGETYHLFYQYNPALNGTVAANQSWGHATSKDLVKWENLPVAIVATESELIFSGSAVIDYNNTSGFGSESTPAMVAIYATAHIEDNVLGRQAVSIAYSLDNGTTFTKYNDGAPVIDLNVSDFRDPNVKWDEQAQHWRLSAVLAESYEVIFFSSTDLKTWSELSRYGPGPAGTEGVFECPDLFSLPDPTDPSKNVSVLIVSVNPGGIAGGSGTWYLLGDYENGTFTPNDRAQAPAGVENWLDFGADNYAGLTFTDAPEPVFIGWMSNCGQDVPTSPWRSANTVPRTLSLRQTANGTLQLHQEPVYTLGQLYSPSLPSTFGYNASSTNQTLEGVSGESLHIDAVIKVGDAATVGFNVRVGDGQYTSVGYNASSSQIFIDRTYSGNSTFNETRFPVYHGGPIQLEGGVVKLTVLVDVASVEVFADSGSQAVLTDIIFPDASSTGVQFFATEGSAELVSFQASNIQSIWGPNDRSNGTSSSTGGGASNSTMSSSSMMPSSSAVASSSGSQAQSSGPVSTASASITSAVSGVASGASSLAATATAAISSAAGGGAGLLPPTQSVAQRYARAILRPDV